MKKTAIANKKRSKLFGVVINPKLSEKIDWENMSPSDIGEKLRQIKFLNKFLLTEYLSNLEVVNISNNKTIINNFVDQMELGTKNKIPHYHLKIEIYRF